MRAVSLHRDVIHLSSALLQLNCVILRARVAEPAGAVQEQAPAAPAGQPVAVIAPGERSGAAEASETFIVDSPLLPEELEMLSPLLAQAGFPAPSGLLATHADWDHLLARLAFPDVPLGCAQSTAERLAGEPGAAQRELRAFDEELYLERPRPLALGALQALPVPGRCEIGEQTLELHPTAGHTPDGMAVWVPWAGVLIAGDYLSSIEIPSLGGAEMLDAYRATLERLRPLLAAARHVVPGHGPVLDAVQALAVLEEDDAYLQSLREHGAGAELPAARRSRLQRKVHAENAAALPGS
jgi:glyoxylase-like metal-dependent hydrolase (beta-lactamase superfamily II)